MPGLRYAAIRAAFELAWASRLAALVRARSAARGMIFTLHRVLPDDPADFAPNAILQVKPDFLAFAITRVRELGYDVVDLDEAIRRLRMPQAPRRFAVFTLDDAYRDNLTYALPVLRRLQCPFTLYVPTALVDGVGEVWWQALEDIVAGHKALAVPRDGEIEYLPAATLAEKLAAYDALYWRMRRMPEPDRVRLIHEIANQYGFDLAAHCRQLIMDWTELKTFAGEQLCTIGAHTVHHHELAKLDAAEAREEIAQSVSIIAAQLGTAPVHLSYPIGAPVSAGPREFAMARDLGLRSAVTTVPGALYERHAEQLWSLPRISLNGLFQARRYVDVFAAPAIFAARRPRLGRAAPSSR
jgi:peptidoglycan/xylan/chitin deacetylase (PgdA/CDA1 family)